MATAKKRKGLGPWQVLKNAATLELRSAEVSLIYHTKQCNAPKVDLMRAYVSTIRKLVARFAVWSAAGITPAQKAEDLGLADLHWTLFVPQNIRAAFWQEQQALEPSAVKGRPMRTLFDMDPRLPKGAALQARLRKQWQKDDNVCCAGLQAEPGSPFGLALRRELDLARPRIATATSRAKYWQDLVTADERELLVQYPALETDEKTYTLDSYKNEFRTKQAERNHGGRPAKDSAKDSAKHDLS